MKTTYDELSKLFKLEDADYRQLKIGLENKIRMINDRDVEILDAELKEWLIEFKSGGCYTVEEVCKLYKITPETVLQLVKTKMISSFRLSTSKGSKLLFLKSELDKENNILLVHTSRRDRLKLAAFGKEMLIILRENTEVSERDFNLFNDYYFGNGTIEELSEKYNINRARANEVLGNLNNRILYLIRDFLTNQKSTEEKLKEYEELKIKYEEQSKIMTSLQDVKKSLDILFSDKSEMVFSKIPIKELDLSVRALNCLKAMDIHTVGELLRIKPKDFLLFKHFGKQSLKEIELVFKKYGVKF